MTDSDQLTLSVRVDGTPGPKGSINAFCIRCGQRGFRQQIAIKEQSEVGVIFRKAIARYLRGAMQRTEIMLLTGLPVETRLTVYIPRQRRVQAGRELDEWVPSHRTPYPMHQKSGDAEKHLRTLHDAMQDAGVIPDDCQVVRTSCEKRWADEEHPPGAEIEIIFLGSAS